MQICERITGNMHTYEVRITGIMRTWRAEGTTSAVRPELADYEALSQAARMCEVKSCEICVLLADYLWDVAAPVADHDDFELFQAAQMGPVGGLAPSSRFRPI